jgi:hypothetical protein
MRPASSVVLALLLLGCGSSAPTGTGGHGGSPTASSSTTSAGGHGGAGPCSADVPCGDKQVCVAGACRPDCRWAGADPCPTGTVCDASDAAAGQCVDPASACVTTSAPETCGGKVCGPGSACDGNGKCYPRVPCGGVTCDDAGCFGTECACARAVDCAPAPLGMVGDVGTLNDPAFTKGIVDLEFDPLCTGWAVTMLSGTDYLRSIAPDGTVASVGGVTNLNMGEVGVLQRLAVPAKSAGHHPRDKNVGVDVSLTYICCATCGCQLTTTPQGASHYEPMATQMLPLVVPSTKITSGAGPFGDVYLDTGPAGLTYGTNHVLYVGNIDVNGDFYTLDLATKTQTLVTTFPKRVYASTPFDAVNLLVAFEGGEIDLVHLPDGAATLWTTSSKPVTGLVRDFFDGSVYVGRNDDEIWKYDAAGTGALFQTAANRPRLTVAPDGYLYAVEIPAVVVGGPAHTVARWALPTTR